MVRPILGLNTYDLSIEERTRFDRPPGRHADWTELLMTFALLGNEYFHQERLERARTPSYGNRQTRPSTTAHIDAAGL